MPQFDVTTFSSQIFWLFVSGFFLLVFVRFVLIPRVEFIFKNRKQYLNKEQKSIQSLEDQLNTIKFVRKQEVELAEKKAHDFLLSIKNDLDQKKIVHMALLEKEMTAKIASFEKTLLNKTTKAKADYKKNVDSYLQTIKQEVTSSGCS